MDLNKRFYIFTGKGGVGKTALSLAFTKYLKDQNKKVVYTYFKNSKLDENSISFDEVSDQAKELGIETLGLDLMDSAKGYITKKLKSKTVASWIIRTPFFKSLINMIPGFNYLIYMGQILEFLVDDPDLIIVLDSPSSGHAITMLEAPKNFNEIFQSGVVFEDTLKMKKVMQQENFLKLNIITIPTLLAIHEAMELNQTVQEIDSFNSGIYCNNCLSEHQEQDQPEFLTNKIENEKKALSENEANIQFRIPYSLAKSPILVIKDLAPSMQNLV